MIAQNESAAETATRRSSAWRQHERVTHADREQQEIVNRFQLGDPPQVTHLVAAEAP